ncbi:MAG: S-layer homology domain-containing protein, partial [Oscillospiraceae bacterium]|nr:S-layer homology domain-containing protein [Oscillospiraceae bacterium]
MTKTKTIKRLFALVLAVVMAAALLPATTLAASTYTDVKEKDWFYTPVTEWSTGTNAILEGYGNGLFGPNDAIKSADLNIILQRILGETTSVWSDSASLTREEAAKLICEALKIETVASPTTSQKFADDSSISSSYREYVYGLKARGYVQGQGNNIFAPKSKFTRAEVLQIVYNCISGFADSSISGGTYDQDLVVRRSGVTLTNVTVRGDLIIGQGVGSGDVTLDGVSVSKRLIILGGGSNSVTLTGSTRISNAVSGKTGTAVHIRVLSGSSITNLTTLASSNTIITGSVTSIDASGANSTISIGANSSSSVSALTVTGAGTTVTIGSYGTLGSGTISANNVSLLGTSGTVTGTITVSVGTGVIVGTPNTTVKVLTNAGTVKDRSGNTIASAGYTGTTDGSGYSNDDATSSGGSSGSSSSGSVTLYYRDKNDATSSKSSGTLSSLSPSSYYPKATSNHYWDGDDGYATLENDEKFSAQDYDFYGWATSATKAKNGEVNYESGTSVSYVDYSSLYAVWGPEDAEDEVYYNLYDDDDVLTLYYRASSTASSTTEQTASSSSTSRKLSYYDLDPDDYYPLST